MRTIVVLALIGLAVSAPVLFTDEQSSVSTDSPFASQGVFYSGTGSRLSHSQAPAAGVPPGSPFTMSAQQPIYWPAPDLQQIFRFDVQPQWVTARWPRVSHCLGESRLLGYRVPLVTCPTPSDIHGSLTYYFDDSQQVQRIIFKGWTGDPAKLTSLVTDQFGLQRQKSLAAGLYLKKSWGKLKGVLRLDHPPVAQQDLPTEKFMVLMELINPKSSLQVSDEIKLILGAMDF